MSQITIIDYKEGGNLFSVKNSLEYLGAKIIISSEPDEIKKASKIIFPGVGSFSKAISQINKLGLKEAIIEKANSEIPFLGICVGMQVLFNSGTETEEANNSEIDGLKIINARVEKFPNKQNFKIPQIGWNQVNYSSSSNPLFKEILPKTNFYFVHSYMVDYEKSQHNITKQFPESFFTTTEYTCKFISSYWNGDNLFACQFHPEKSGEAGLQLLRNFINL